MLDFIKEKINRGKRGLAKSIYNSTWRPSGKYQDIISTLFKNPNEVEYILDLRQRYIFKSVLEKVKSADKAGIFIIEGAPGTGKSFLAMVLLAYLYKNLGYPEDKVRCLLKNKDARKACCQIVDNPDIVNLNDSDDINIINQQAIINNVITCGGPAVFRDNCQYDCLICDEAQRMPKFVLGDKTKTNLESIINQSRVSVFFIDEKQSVSVNDFITKARIKACETKEKKVEYSKLDSYHRCPPEYLGFIKNLLYPSSKKVKPFKELSNYTVRLVETPVKLKRIIDNKNGNELKYDNCCLDVTNAIQNRTYPSRILAGRDKDWDRDNKIIVDKKDNNIVCHFEIEWEDRDKYSSKDKKNNSYWLDQESLDQAGHIDCSQGLDFNYVGVIIANDLEYDKNCGEIKVKLCNHRLKDTNLSYIYEVDNKGDNFKEAQGKIGKIIYDTIIKGNHKGDSDFNRVWKEYEHQTDDERYKELGEYLQKKLILNTYNVLLSRGTKGCYIYCCNDGLQKYLHDTLKVPYAEEES